MSYLPTHRPSGHDGSMKALLQGLLGPVDQLTPVRRGYAHNERAVAVARDGHSVFAKRAVDEETAGWLRSEHRMYEALAGTDLAPRLLGWIDDDLPVLVLEDLSGCVWPPPWDAARIGAVLTALARVAEIRPPVGLPALADETASEQGWDLVLAEPAEFLSLGICDPEWLERTGPDLARASAGTPLSGDRLLHCDVRSDNLCLCEGRAVLFDWNLACTGNPMFDVAFWLPSLESEGGPPPEVVAPACPPELAAYVAGFFAARAGQPVIPHAPAVRQVQLTQLRSALPWAVRALGLEHPQPPRGGGQG